VSIRSAAAVPALAARRPATLFPATSARDPARRGPFTPRAATYLTHRGATANVSFVATWPVEPKGTASHGWRAFVENGVASLVSESGPVPPQPQR
jgi:hypothetical protein